MSLGLLRGSCEQSAVAACVYCGRPFCGDHGHRGADHTDICARRGCRAKLRDVQAHHQWKQRVQESNRSSMCAREECEERMRHQCSRCRMMFCPEHVKSYRIVDNGASTPRQARALVCAHCNERRRLWS